LYQAGAIRFEMFALHAWNNVATSLDVAYRNARFDEDRSWWEAIKQANSKDALLHTAALLFGLKVAGLGLHPLHQAAISQRAQRNSLEINIRQFQKLSAEIQAKLEAAEGVPACGAVREQTRRLIELGDRIHGIGERGSRVGFEQQSRWLAMRQWLARGVEPALSPAHETLAARIRHEDPVGYLNEISETLYLRGQRYQDIDIHRVMDGMAADLQTLRNPQAAAPEHAAAVNRLVSLVEHYRSLGRDAIGDHFTLGLIDGLYAPAAEQPVPFAVAARSAGGARFSPTAETSVPIFLYPDSAPETSPGVRPIPFVEQIFGRGLDPRRFAILGRRGAGHDFEDVYVFPVESPAVSQEHAMIFINPKGQRVLKDLSSGNPKVPGFRTWVREEAIPGFPLWRPLRLREEVVLRPETEFALGRETPEHPETVRYRLSPDGEGLMAVEN
jgi:hypothetical protein